MSDPDRRKVWFSETLALGLGASLVTWGEPDEDGFYNPVLTRAATPAPLDVHTDLLLLIAECLVPLAFAASPDGGRRQSRLAAIAAAYAEETE